MASGKSLELRYLTRDKIIEPRHTKERDRSLIGKALIKARRNKKTV